MRKASRISGNLTWALRKRCRFKYLLVMIPDARFIKLWRRSMPYILSCPKWRLFVSELNNFFNIAYSESLYTGGKRHEL